MVPPPWYCRAVRVRTTVLHLAVLMAAKGAAQGSGLWINGETLTQRANTETNVRLYLGVASFSFLPQRVEHVSDHVADLLKFRYAEAARRACGRTHADAACLRGRWEERRVGKE